MLGGDLTCMDPKCPFEVLPSRQIKSIDLKSLQYACGVVTKKTCLLNAFYLSLLCPFCLALSVLKM